jgi:hypothetical protein
MLAGKPPLQPYTNDCNSFMTSVRAPRLLVFLAVGAALILSAGCSWLLPARKGVTRSFDLAIDSRRAAAPALTGCFIPATFPAVTKLPVVFLQQLPPGAKITSVKAEVILKNEQGDPLVVLEPVIEKNHVYLKFAVGKKDAFTQWQVVVTAKYEYHL